MFNNIAMLPRLPKSCSSCLDCKERFVGCHSKCKKYKEFKDKLDTMRKNQYNGMDYRSEKINKMKNDMIKKGVY